MAIRYAFKKLTRWADVRAKPHFSLEARPGTFEISIRVDAEGDAHDILFNLVPKFRFSDFGILLRLGGSEPSGIVAATAAFVAAWPVDVRATAIGRAPRGFAWLGCTWKGWPAVRPAGTTTFIFWPPGISTAIVSPPFAVGGTVTVSGPLGTAATGATGSPATTTTSSVLVMRELRPDGAS